MWTENSAYAHLGAKHEASFETEADVGGADCTETESELLLGRVKGQGQRNTPMAPRPHLMNSTLGMPISYKETMQEQAVN